MCLFENIYELHKRPTRTSSRQEHIFINYPPVEVVHNKVKKTYVLKEITAAKNVFSPQRLCMLIAFTGPTNSAGLPSQSTPEGGSQIKKKKKKSKCMYTILSGASCVYPELLDCTHLLWSWYNSKQCSHEYSLK